MGEREKKKCERGKDRRMRRVRKREERGEVRE